MTTEADEIRAARQAPSAHSLKTVSHNRLHDAATAYGETTLILSENANYQTGLMFRTSARCLFFTSKARFCRFWFENQTTTGKVDYAEGIVDSWKLDGEIHFADGTRLNERLLLRVTF